MLMINMKWQTWPFRFPVCDPAKSEYDSPFVLLHYLDVRNTDNIEILASNWLSGTNEGLILHCTFVRGYSTLTHRKIASGKVPIMKRREMMTSNQPQHPSLPEFLSEERAENALHPVAVRAHRGSISDAPVCKLLNPDQRIQMMQWKSTCFWEIEKIVRQYITEFSLIVTNV